MKLLSGSELVGYIKERQAKQVRGLRQAYNIIPRLAIIQTIDDPVIDTYVRLKKRYGEDILIEVDHYKVNSYEVESTIEKLNSDPSTQAIIIQLPLDRPEDTDRIINLVAPEKDVDGLGQSARFDAATALAINWLMAGYNIDLTKHKILIIGQGRLVGAPLYKMWKNSGFDVNVVDDSITDLAKETSAVSLIVSGTGVPGLVKDVMVPHGAVVVDAGTASDSGKIKGDIDPLVYEREDISITPQTGGVGPLTVAALFDNVIRACQRLIPKD